MKSDLSPRGKGTPLTRATDTPFRSIKRKGTSPAASSILRGKRPAILAASIAGFMALCVAPQGVHGQTWTGTTNGDWNTATNWNPATVPNNSGSASVIFDASSTTAVLLSQQTFLGSLTFTSNATSPYTISLKPSVLTVFFGTGVTNNSGVTQNFEITSVGTGNGSSGQLDFAGSSSAGSLTQYTNDGSTVNGGLGGNLDFSSLASAGSATIINLGGTVAGAGGGITTFEGGSKAGSATLTTNGGSNGGGGGVTYFSDSADGGTARAITNGNGIFDISRLSNGGMKIGSIEGSGNYYLGGNSLTVGGNDLSTTVSGVIADGGVNGGTGGALIKTGTGTLILDGTNTYTGNTTINAGNLQLGTVATAGKLSSVGSIGVNSGGTLTVVNSFVSVGHAFIGNNMTNGVGGVGTVNIDSANSTVLTGVLTDGAAGQLALTQSGSGQTILANTGNTYTGATTVSGGSLWIGGAPLGPDLIGSINGSSVISAGNGGTFVVYHLAGDTLANNVTNNVGGTGTLDIISQNNINLSGTLTNGTGGSLALTVSGNATITNANNTYSGPTTVTGGAANLQIGTPTSAGSIGLGAVTVTGGGGLILVNAQGGALTNSISNPNNDIFPSYVVFDSAANVVYLGSISGKLEVHQEGTGTTTFLGNSTYTGQTLVENGVLEVRGSLASGVGINIGGTLTGNGTIQGTVFDGGNLVPGSLSFPGTINVGGLNLSSQITFRLGTGTNDLVNDAGDLTVGGHVNILQKPGFGPGTYTLINYGGTLSSVNGGFFPVSGVAGYNTSIVTTTPGVIQLAVSYLGTAQNWDGSGAANDGVVSGGNGSWNTTGTNWTNASGTVNAKWQGGTAIFDGGLGTVTITAPVSAQAVFFNSGNYTIGGLSSLTLTGPSPAINVSNSALAQINAPIAGNGGFIAGGLGTLTLGNPANTYSGGTTVIGGTLQIGAPGLIGSVGSGTIFVQNGGTLSLMDLPGTSLSNNITNGLAGVGTVQTTFLNNFTLSGSLSDGALGAQLALDITLGGTIILTNSGNDYTGSTTVSQSTLQIGTATAAGSIGPSSPVQIHMGGTLSVVNVQGNILPNNISNSGGNTGTLSINSANTITLSGMISDTDGTGLGKIAFIQNGTGKTILTNTDSYTGGTTVSGGTLQIGNGTQGNLTGTGTVTVSNTASVVLDQPDGSTMAPPVVLNGIGTALNAIQSGNLAITGVISGTGGFNQNGTGTTELQAGETYTGATNVNAGTLQVDTSLAAGSTVHVGTNGTLIGGGTIGGNATLTGNGTIQLSTNGGINGTLGVTGGNWIGTGAVGGLITSSSGTFTIANGASLTATTGLNVTGGTLAGAGGALIGSLTYTSGASSTFGDVISGNGTLTLNNSAATLSLTADNTYTGATTVTAGTLNLAGSLASATTVNIGNSGTLSGSGTVNGNANLTGNGTVNFGASGNIVGTLGVAGGRWNGVGSVGGLVTVSSNTFTINGTLTAPADLDVTGGSIAGTGTLNGNLSYTSSSNSTFGGIIAGTGISLIMNTAASTLTLTGNNTYTGGTTINGGTLQVGNGTSGNLGATSVTVNNSGIFATNLATNSTVAVDVNLNSATSALNAIQSGTNTLSGVVSGSGVFNQKGTGTTILSNSATYTGATNITTGTLQIGDGTNGNLLGTNGVTVSGTGSLATDLPDGAIFFAPVNLSVATTALKTIQSGTNTLSGVISGTGSFNQNGAGTTLLTAPETYTGLTKVNAGTLEVDGSLAAVSTVNVATGGTLSGTGTIQGKATLTGNGTIDFGVGGNIVGTLGITGGNWTGVGSVGGIVTSSSGNFNLTGSLTAPAGLAVTGGTLAGSGTLIGKLNYTSTASSTFGGAIVGTSATLTKAGASTLALTGASTYTGATTISAGALQIGNGTTGNLSGTSGVSVAGTSILAMDLADGASFTPNIALAATGASLKAIQSGTNTISGLISGTGSFNQSGLGTTVLNNNETYTGVTNVNTGILELDGTLAATSAMHIFTGGTLTGTGTVKDLATLTGNGTIDFGVGGNIVGTLGITGGNWAGVGSVGGIVTSSLGNFNLSGNLTAPAGLAVTGGTLAGGGTLTGKLNYTSATSSTFGGVIAGTGATLTKAGASTLTLTGTNTYTGATIVSAGTLQVGNGTTGSLSNTSNVTISGTGAFATDFASGWTFAPNISLSATGASLKAIQSGTNTFSGVISGTGAFNQNGSGTTILTATETYSGVTNVNAGTLEVDGSLSSITVAVATGGTLTGTGTLHGKATMTGNGVIDLDSGGNINGTLGVTGGNWTGVGTVGGLVTSSSGNFNLNGSLTAPVGLTVTGGTLAGSGTLTGKLTYSSTASSTFGGVIAGTSATLSKAGVSTLTLTGHNTYTGLTTITAGTLQIGNGSIAGASLGSGNVTVGSAGTLAIDLADGDTFSNNVTDSGHITDIAPSGTHTITSLIGGTGTFTKTGAGTAALTAANTYTGATTVSGGTLLANNVTGFATGTGTISVNNGGTLGGSGITKAVTLNTGGLIAPGAGLLGTAGTTLHASSLLWNAGGTLKLQLGPTGDELVLSGALTKGTLGTYTLDLIDAGIVPGNYTLATFASTTFLSSNFTLELPAGYDGSLVETSTSLSINLSAHAQSVSGGTLALNGATNTVGDTTTLSGGSLIVSGSTTTPASTTTLIGGTLTVGSVTEGSSTTGLFTSNSLPVSSPTLGSLTVSPNSTIESAPATTLSADNTLPPTSDSVSFTLAPTPEPGSALLLTLGAGMVLGWRRRRN